MNAEEIKPGFTTTQPEGKLCAFDEDAGNAQIELASVRDFGDFGDDGVARWTGVLVGEDGRLWEHAAVFVGGNISTYIYRETSREDVAELLLERHALIKAVFGRRGEGAVDIRKPD